MIPLSMDSLLEILRKKGITAEIQKETKQVFFAFQLEDKQFPIFIRIFDDSQLLQIVVFFPLELEESAIGDTARLLHWINQAIDLPGFGLEEGSKTLFYRVMLPALGMRLDENLLEPFLVAIKGVCETFSPMIGKVAAGEISFEEARKSTQG